MKDNVMALVMFGVFSIVVGAFVGIGGTVAHYVFKFLT